MDKDNSILTFVHFKDLPGLIPTQGASYLQSAAVAPLVTVRPIKMCCTGIAENKSHVTTDI